MKKRTGEKETDILKAAVVIFGRHGFHNAKMAWIAEEAGVSAGTLYNYFSNKNHLLDRIFEDLWKVMSSSIYPLMVRDDLNPVEKIESVIDLLFDSFIRNSSLTIVFVNEFNSLLKNQNVSFGKYYNKFLDIFVALTEEGAREGFLNANIPPLVTYNFIMGGIRKIIYEVALDPDQYDHNAIRQDVKYMIKRGILVK